MKKVYWDENANPIGTRLANIIYELRSDDNGDDLILDAVCVDDFEENSENIAYDALVTEYRLLERKMNVMRRVMNRVSADLKVREDNGPDDMGVIISKPFKRNGTSNVAVLFQLTDGQTISIVLHNPDTTPNKIAPTDELISWKWMVNKKDVTIAVAPENGKDLNVNEVARRIMRLAEKNSAAFKRANERRAERIANIEKQKAEIDGLEAELARAKSDCEAAEVEYQDALEKLDTKKKERTEAIEKAEERKREQEKREAEELAKKEAEDSKRQDDLRKAMESLGLRTQFVKAIEQNIKPGKYHGNFVWEADGLGFLEEIGLADYSQNAKTGIYYAQNGERLNDAESQAIFEKFVSGLQIDLTPGKPPVYMFNDGTRMTDSEMVSLVTGDEVEKQNTDNIDSKDTNVVASNVEELTEVIGDVLKTKTSVLNAYKRPDMSAPIDIVYGNEKMGIHHLINGREKDGTLSILTTDELVESISKTIVNGTITPVFTSKDGKGDRLKISLGESEVVLVKNQGENSWLLTGWVLSKETLAELAKLPPDERRSAFFNSAPTHTSSTASRTSVGAGVTNDSNTGSTQGQRNDGDPQWDADKALCESILAKDKFTEDEIEDLIEKVLDACDRADESGIEERKSLTGNAFDKLQDAAIGLGESAKK